MKIRTRTHRLHGLFASLLAAALAGCGGGDGGPGAGAQAGAHGAAAGGVDTLATTLLAYPLQPPSVEQAEALAFIREEEALAHAVYVANAARWPSLPIFNNIAASELTHTTAVQLLLDRYQLADPLAQLPVGSFRTPAFEALYTQLVQSSGQGLLDALKVGALIEELDIHDIEARSAGLANADIQLVYDHLLRGSRNHLRAYVQTLQQQGGSYTPQYLSQSEFDAIVGSPMEPGGP